MKNGFEVQKRRQGWRPSLTSPEAWRSRRGLKRRLGIGRGVRGRGLREEFGKQYQQFVSLSEEVEKIRAEKERRAKERELMVFQSKEIEASGIQTGEEESLKEERVILAHAKKLMDFAHATEETLYSGEGWRV